MTTVKECANRPSKKVAWVGLQRGYEITVTGVINGGVPFFLGTGVYRRIESDNSILRVTNSCVLR